MSNDVTLSIPTKSEVTHDDQKIFIDVKSLTVKDKESHGLAQTLLRRLAAGKKFIVEKLAGIKQSAHKTWKDVCTLETEQVAPYDAATRVVNGLLDTYEREERRRAEQLAIEKAAKENKEAEERKIREAELAVAGGATEAEGLAIIEEEIPVAPVQVLPEFKKTSGVSNVTRMKGHLKDPRAFVRWLAQQPDDEGWFQKFQLAQEDLNAAARMHGMALAKRIPGLAAEEVSARSVKSL